LDLRSCCSRRGERESVHTYIHKYLLYLRATCGIQDPWSEPSLRSLWNPQQASSEDRYTMGLSEWPIDTDPSHSHTHTHTLTLTHSSGQAGRPGRRAGGKGSRRTASAFQLRPQLAHPLTPSHRCPIRPFRIASPHNSLRGMYVEYIRTWPSAPSPRKWPDRGVWVCQRWPAVPCFPCPTETTNFHRGLPLRLTPQPAVLHHKYINDRGGGGGGGGGRVFF